MLQYDVHPFIGNTFGPIIFMICVLGGLGNMIGGFIAAFIISQIISIGGYYFSHRAVLCAGIYVVHRPDVRSPARHVQRDERAMHAWLGALAHSAGAVPLFAPPYFLHLAIQVLIWGFIYTAWSMMGRFGFVSLGHGAFMGVGAYVPALLWNYLWPDALARHSARRGCSPCCWRW